MHDAHAKRKTAMLSAGNPSLKDMEAIKESIRQEGSLIPYLYDLEHSPQPIRPRRNAAAGLLLVSLILAIGVTAARCQTELPENPQPQDVGSGVRVLGKALLDKPVKPDSFFADRNNRHLMMAEVAMRTMDAISTRRNLTNPCHCFIEGENYFSDGQFFPSFGRWKGAANSFAGEMTYGLMMSGMEVGESYIFWRIAQHRKPGKIRKLLEGVAREPMAFDIQNNFRNGFLRNERYLSEYGK